MGQGNAWHQEDCQKLEPGCLGKAPVKRADFGSHLRFPNPPLATCPQHTLCSPLYLNSPFEFSGLLNVMH